VSPGALDEGFPGDGVQLLGHERRVPVAAPRSQAVGRTAGERHRSGRERLIRAAEAAALARLGPWPPRQTASSRVPTSGPRSGSTRSSCSTTSSSSSPSPRSRICS
jgi:hypothetical protein